MKAPVRISCNEPDWQNVARQNLKDGIEVDLINFNADYDTELCKEMAKEYSMVFRVDAQHRAGFFEKPKQ